MTTIFHNIDLFRIINKYTDLRSFCERITDFSGLCNVHNLTLP